MSEPECTHEKGARNVAGFLLCIECDAAMRWTTDLSPADFAAALADARTAAVTAYRARLVEGVKEWEDEGHAEWISIPAVLRLIEETPA